MQNTFTSIVSIKDLSELKADGNAEYMAVHILFLDFMENMSYFPQIELQGGDSHAESTGRKLLSQPAI